VHGRRRDAPRAAEPTADPALFPQRDGSHDFDFLIGDWKAHVRRLPDRLDYSNTWVVYDGISNHHKLLDTNANFEEFNVTSTDKKLHIKGQTLRMYNPATRQWSIYLVDLDNGTLDVPPVVGSFTGPRGEFYHQEQWASRTILVRYPLCLARPRAQVVAHGAILLPRRRQNLGSQLDLRV
jgi:hypothetical protein